MKRSAFLFVALLFIAQSVLGASLNPTFTGSWYNPNQNGHGLSVEVMDANTTLIYWYVYHTDGTPMFLITVGTNNGNTVTGPTYYQSGMKFGEFNPNDLEQVVWGEASFTVHDCQNATFSYSLDDPEYGSGSIDMIRLTDVEGVKCTNNPIQNSYHLTLMSNSEAAFGTMWIFENGYTAFFAANENGALTGFGQSTIVQDDRWELDFATFDLFGAGWEEQFAAGEFSAGYVNATFDGGQVIGTAIHNFQQAVSYSALSDTYDIYNYAEAKIIGTVTLDSAGNLNGNTFDGCSIAGQYLIPDQRLNQIYTEFSVTNCSKHENWWGAGNAGKDVIGLALSDQYGGHMWFLQR